MDFLDIIHTRRSIRKFTSEPISNEDLDKILRAAMAAPTAVNVKEWHFIVEQDKEQFKKIAENHVNAQMAKEAHTCIFVCADLNLEKFPGFWKQDCAAAIQNILLAARALNIGSVWCGVHPRVEREEAFKKMYNLPDNIAILGLVVLGHCDPELFKTKENYMPEQIHYGKW